MGRTLKAFLGQKRRRSQRCWGAGGGQVFALLRGRWRCGQAGPRPSWPPASVSDAGRDAPFLSRSMVSLGPS